MTTASHPRQGGLADIRCCLCPGAIDLTSDKPFVVTAAVRGDGSTLRGADGKPVLVHAHSACWYQEEQKPAAPQRYVRTETGYFPGGPDRGKPWQVPSQVPDQLPSLPEAFVIAGRPGVRPHNAPASEPPDPAIMQHCYRRTGETSLCGELPWTSAVRATVVFPVTWICARCRALAAGLPDPAPLPTWWTARVVVPSPPATVVEQDVAAPVITTPLLPVEPVQQSLFG